ncbi:RAD55 family ATPase [Halorientalis salina]|uniref:RAD55 family ATPase n=1 Tax=Halorientalis salina TaxID=2932266 RepID=UPI0010ACD799|nr:transcriptional regulator [Halorientalis salina]
MTGDLSTGVDLLDSAMGGGVPPGSLVALTAPPRAQSEPLLYEMAAANPTRYLSTLRTSEEVTEAITATLPSTSGVSIDVRAVDGDEILANPEQSLGSLDSHSLVIIDPTTELEQGDRERYRSFLDTCKRALRMTDSVGLFHCHENNPAVLRRDMTLTRADLVWDVCVEVIDDNVRTRMAITKFRGGTPFGLVDLNFSEGGVTADARR